ncbi:Ig-like domain-containing protein [Cellulophaga sp. Hel_I_12]|uniref:Ig-like domain-containing protein n=1 Tax=Cellulophaga sp. Hel_I_12 TaxID=1249972 RepID=UPI00064630D9|nr:Ig-like domain-containing protein [Cellulophaga sp. Hel_I_12]
MESKAAILYFLRMLFFIASSTLWSQKSSPVANTDNYVGSFNNDLVISAVNGVLHNDTDANGVGSLSVITTPISNPTNGSLVLNSDGSFTFAPNPGFIGTDSFEYRVCDDGSPNNIISQFDFNSTPLTTATIGPNATSINTNAVQTACGLRIPSTASGGSAGLDVVVPNTGGIFNFTSFQLDFEYRDQEGTADIVSGGNFRVYHIGANTLGITLNLINGSTNLPLTITQSLGNFLPNSATYSIAYNSLNGTISYTANGTTVNYTVAPAFSPLRTALASNIIIGQFMDNSGSTLPSICSMAFTDTSRLCDDGTVSLTFGASAITNRKITYRVKKE